MKEIIEILMRRDGVTYEEAEAMYMDCKSEMMDAFYGTSCRDVEEVLQYELGLEPDYIFNFI